MTLATIAPPPLGSLLDGRYRLLEEVWRGRRTVYRATDLVSGRTVAVKVGHDTELVDEARAGARLAHPSVAKVLDAGTLGGGVYAVSEWVDGVPLAAALPLADPGPVLAAIADALEHAHGRGVAFGGLEPEDVLVDRSGGPKLLGVRTTGRPAADLEALARLREMLPPPAGTTATLPITPVDHPDVEPAPAPEPVPRAGRRRVRPRVDTRLLVGLAGGLLSLMAAVSWYGSRPVSVPAVRGLDAATASGLLDATGFEARTVHAYDPEVPSGEVLQTLPTPGTLAARGTTVRVYVSDGPQPVDLPDVVGRRRSDAARRLERAGFSVGEIREERSDDVGAGRVVSTDPPGAAPPGSAVALVVSTGR